MKINYLLLGAPLALASSSPSPLDTTWDYIIVGSGASGIPLADRLSESDKSVLLIERGFASSSRWGGTWKPSWLEGTNLTRFDVPGLAQTVWLEQFKGAYACDTPAPAGCLLGGGTAVNAGQFYLPTANDFDLNQPPGFRSKDMVSAISKAKQRLPWTDRPSKDGKSYLTNGSSIAYNALTNKANSNAFRFITANEERDDRSRVSSWPEYFFLNGEKGGPMATYLITASQRKNFRLQLNTTVARVIRRSDTVTGVDVEASGPGGLSGHIKVKPETGRVILSAGVFNTFKILVRSGVGPTAQLEQLTNHTTEAAKLPPKKDWLSLPAGQNVGDGPNFSLLAHVPYVEAYPWEALLNSSKDNPDVKKYLESRSGPLAQLQGSIGPVSWDTVLGDDGKKRVIQWDVGSGVNALLSDGGGYIVFTSNLNLGQTSRGTLSLLPNPALSVNISKSPYFNDPGNHDFAAVVKSATSIVEIMKTIPNASIIWPPPGTSVEQYLLSQTPASNNHWVGAAHMGEDCKDKSAVVDARTVVCGMRNLHVVDASVFNGLPTANPQATFVVMAERAAEIILRLSGY